MELSLRLVRQVRPAVEARTRRTAMRRSHPAERLAGARVWLKLECDQVTGSFKVRGPLALRACSEDARPWVTASAGNHGLGVAYALCGRGRPPRVFVPRTAPEVKRQAITALDAEIRVVDTSSYDETEAEARRWAAETGARFVSPFDDEIIMAGNGGTLGLEILEQLPDLGSVLVPVGGGGLCSGLACVIRALRPSTRIIGVQSEATPAMYESFRRGAAVTRHAGRPTLAEGLDGGVSTRSYEYAKRWLDDMRLVSESAIADAMRWICRSHQVRVEGSAAVGVAALRSGDARLPEPVCIVLTGSNVDDDTWDRIWKS
ncbi:MAG: threonine/serine dehydratase [Candidatus Krumholzibacteriia bacterium]